MISTLRPVICSSLSLSQYNVRLFLPSISRLSVDALRKAPLSQHSSQQVRCRKYHSSLTVTTSPTNPRVTRKISYAYLCMHGPRCRLPDGSPYLIHRRSFSEFHDKPKSGRSPRFSEIDLKDPRIRLAGVAIIIAALYFVYHLERVPETGRWRFIAVSEEMEVGLQNDQYNELLEEYRGNIIPADHPLARQIRDVISTILTANGLGTLSYTFSEGQSQKGDNAQSADTEIWDPDATQAEMSWSSDEQTVFDNFSGGKRRKWNLIVVNDDSTVNAMVVNGNIVVFTGILPVAHDIDGLAAILSHEIAHVVARHLSEKLSSTVLFKAIFFVLDVLGIDPGLGPLVVDFFYHLPNSRTMELEADKIGLQLASRACFDPRGAVSMQTRMEKLGAENSPRINLTFLQTHPSGQTRIKLLSDALPEAYVIRAGSSACAQLEDDFDAFRAMAERVRNEQEQEPGELE